MKIELFYLLCSALLTGSLWIPVVIGYVLTRGLPTADDYRRAPSSPLPDWVNRANRAHLNAVESFAPFAAVVLAATAAGTSNAVTESCAAVYFYARVAHAVVHIGGFGLLMARTLAFTVAWIAFAIFAAEVLHRAI
ncbi:MAG TPA: MAPEG family protein [Acidiferrobacterales bacterium]|nr:MAPEG family protein [Acidiferrobacterales bacterium]